ncbi:MAG: class I SAM-dependent methyltransferase [Anaerolineales bacterium]|jgi:demethylmenaquinone methyltransferase/2-methoxy-6-polyprenyl-1,4-benzoquinol methylase
MPFDHFNLIAGFYDRAGPFRVSELLLELLSLSPDYLLLDAGGGTGRISAVMRSMVKGVFVADPSRGMTRRAAVKGLSTVCTRAESLPFPSGSFDRVIMVDALHHVIDQHQTAHELFRVLVPGGRILIVEPDIHQFMVRVIAIGEKVLLMRSHFLSGDKIADLFTDLKAKTSVYYEGLNVISFAEKVR